MFVNCLIENPSFSSQTKECLTSKITHFGSRCQLPRKFLEEVIERTHVLEILMSWLKAKEFSALVQSGSNTSRIHVSVPKLYDANHAGGTHSLNCTLILTEGDSAKALAVSGLSIIGRDRYGVYPLRGKLLNVSEASPKQLAENEEVQHVVKALGLQYDKKYDLGKDGLRYGKVLVMTDQDYDGK